MNKLLYPLFFVATGAATLAIAQPPAEVVGDGFSDEATAWLKKHPDVKKCADQMVGKYRKGENLRNPDDVIVTSDQYGEYIGECDKKSQSKANPPKALKGDALDKNPNAKPRSISDAKNKNNGREWQDDNGLVHYPDGSVTSRPID